MYIAPRNRLFDATVRPVEQWVEIFGTTDATQCSAEEAIADRLLKDLCGYREGNKYRDADVRQIAHALEAYARMVQSAGLKLGGNGNA